MTEEKKEEDKTGPIGRDQQKITKLGSGIG